jgi:hypothetical protein
MPKKKQNKIQKIAAQAYEDVIKNTPSFLVTREMFEQQFAKTMIKECQVALKPMLRDMVSRGQAYDLIREHFGVEE